MKIKFFCLALSCLLILSLSGCGNNPDSPKTDDNENISGNEDELLSGNIVATVNGREITYERYEMTLETYKKYYDEMGFNIGDDDSDFSSFQERTLDSLIKTEAIISRAFSEGYDKLNEKETKELNEKIETEIASLGDTYEDQINQELKKNPDADKDELLKKYIAAESYYYTGTNMTYDEYLEYIRTYTSEQYYLERLKKDTISGIDIKEETVKETYSSSFESDKKTYSSNPELYGAAFDSDNEVPPLFAPEGYSRIYALYFNANDAINNQEYKDNLARINEICSEYGEIELKASIDPSTDISMLPALAQEYKELISSNSEIRTALANKPITSADNALKALKGGKSFEKVMEDEGQNVIARAISPLYQADADWEKVVKKAFTQLKPGEFSDVIETSTGYYIIYYIDDITPGEYGYDNARDKIYNVLLTNAQEKAWQEETAKWADEADVSINKTLLYSAGK